MGYDDFGDREATRRNVANAGLPSDLRRGSRPGAMAEILADLAVDHDTAIRLIEMNMRAIRENRADCPAREELIEWTRLTRVMQTRNTPVVMFLIRIIADLGMVSWPEPEVLLRALRRMAAERMAHHEQMMRDLGTLS